jgi:hypothetical protein
LRRQEEPAEEADCDPDDEPDEDGEGGGAHGGTIARGCDSDSAGPPALLPERARSVVRSSRNRRLSEMADGLHG